MNNGQETAMSETVERLQRIKAASESLHGEHYRYIVAGPNAGTKCEGCGEPWPCRIATLGIAADRLERADAVIEVARAALVKPDEYRGDEFGSWCVFCGGSDPNDEVGHARAEQIGHYPDCPRQKALTAITEYVGR